MGQFDRPSEREAGVHARRGEVIQPVGPHDAHPSPGVLDLNTASEAELAKVDFIGHKLAAAIVEYRAKNGPFERWDELSNIHGVDAKKVAELQRAARIPQGVQ